MMMSSPRVLGTGACVGGAYFHAPKVCGFLQNLALSDEKTRISAMRHDYSMRVVRNDS